MTPLITVLERVEEWVEERVDDPGTTRRRHLVFGWSMVAAFMLLGVCLESLHALKLGWYLDLANETRRLMLRLAHAHGVLLGVLNICFALTWAHGSRASRGVERLVSTSFLAGSLLLPAGFLLGGVVVHGGDPNPLIALSPLGALLLVVGALGMVWRLRSGSSDA